MKKSVGINAERLIAARYALGMSRKGVSELSGVSLQTVANIENRKVCVKPATLKRICDVLSIPVTDVIIIE